MVRFSCAYHQSLSALRLTSGHSVLPHPLQIKISHFHILLLHINLRGSIFSGLAGPPQEACSGEIPMFQQKKAPPSEAGQPVPLGHLFSFMAMNSRNSSQSIVSVSHFLRSYFPAPLSPFSRVHTDRAEFLHPWRQILFRPCAEEIAPLQR